MATAPRSATHSRNPSNVAIPQRAGSRASHKAGKQPTEPEVHYTLLVRLPCARGDFVDPPQVDWNAAKDQALWEHISRSSKTSDLDWEELASSFDVPHAFLLQQAAWLYERHLSHVRAQMRKVAPSTAHTPSPVPPGSGSSTMVGGVPMKRLGSGGAGGSRATSALSTRPLESTGKRMSVAEGSGQGTPRPTGLSRNPSTATVTQSRHTKAQEGTAPPSPRQPVHRSFRSSIGQAQEGRRSLEQQRQPRVTPTTAKDVLSPTGTSPASSDSDASSSSDGENAVPAGIRASQVMRRGPTWLKGAKQKLGTVDDESPDRDNDEDEDDNALPFAAVTTAKPSARSDTRQTNAPRRKDKQPAVEGAQTQRAAALPPDATSRAGLAVGWSKRSAPAAPSSQRPRHTSPPDTTTTAAPRSSSADMAASTSAASASSSAASSSVPQHDGPSARSARGKVSALSPRHRAELARLSPRGANKAEGSEGTPSMGSSFSDLDDASISQSALEEALLSKMQHGAASRVSNFSQALRSKYLH